jgi:spore coat protein U domain-containing protein, fimbrial subunit CupE1/2/3/6
MKRFLLATTVIVAATLVAPSAWAATTGTIAVSATVSTVCSLGTTPLNFGEVALTGATTGATPGTATITVTCTGGGAYSVGLDSGLNNVAAQRNLKSGSNLLAYGLFTDLAHGTVWPVAPGVAGIGNAAVQSLTVYGLIPAGLPIVSGSGIPYTDTVTVTVTY